MTLKIQSKNDPDITITVNLADVWDELAEETGRYPTLAELNLCLPNYVKVYRKNRIVKDEKVRKKEIAWFARFLATEWDNLICHNKQRVALEQAAEESMKKPVSAVKRLELTTKAAQRRKPKAVGFG